MASPDERNRKILKAKKTMPPSYRKQVVLMNKLKIVEPLETATVGNNVPSGIQNLGPAVKQNKCGHSENDASSLDSSKYLVCSQKSNGFPLNLLESVQKNVVSETRLEHVDGVVSPYQKSGKTIYSLKKLIIEEAKNSQNTSVNHFGSQANIIRSTVERHEGDCHLKCLCCSPNVLRGAVQEPKYKIMSTLNGQGQDKMVSYLETNSQLEFLDGKQNNNLNSDSWFVPVERTPHLMNSVNSIKYAADGLKTDECSAPCHSSISGCGSTDSTCHPFLDIDSSNGHNLKKRMFSENKENVKRVKMSVQNNGTVSVAVEKQRALLEQVHHLIRQEIDSVNYNIFDNKLKELNERIEKTQCRSKHEAIANELFAKVAKLQRRIKTLLSQRNCLEANILSSNVACKDVNSGNMILNKKQEPLNGVDERFTLLNSKPSAKASKKVDLSMEHIDLVSESKMSSKRKNRASPTESISKRHRNAINLNIKMNIIRAYESGKRVNTIAREQGMAHSTVCSILKDKQRISEAVKESSGMNAVITRQRKGLIHEMEKLLILWIEDQIQKRIPIGLLKIQAKARSLFSTLKERAGEACSETFTASHGWFFRFQRRFHHHSAHVKGEAAGTREGAIQLFKSEFNKIVSEGNYLPGQIFNVDETRLYWNKMPEQTYIYKEAKAMPGFKVFKDRVTLLLGGNVAGFKLKPFMIDEADNPCAFKKIAKQLLPVYYRSNRRAWMTQDLFEDWFFNCFIPQVKDYCMLKGIPFKVLLLLVNTPAHPLQLHNLHPDITIVYLPKYTTSVLQPMDQGAISMFKAHYLQSLFSKAIAATEDGKATLCEFWKDYNIFHCIKNIAAAWDDVSVECMQGIWDKCLNRFSAFVNIFEGFDQNEKLAQINGNILLLTKSLGLELDAGDVNYLIGYKEGELSNEELIELKEELEVQRNMEEEEQKSVEVFLFLVDHLGVLCHTLVPPDNCPSNDDVMLISVESPNLTTSITTNQTDIIIKSKNSNSPDADPDDVVIEKRTFDSVVDLTNEGWPNCNTESPVSSLESPSKAVLNSKETTPVAQIAAQVPESFEHLPPLPEAPSLQPELVDKIRKTLPPQKPELRVKRVLKPRGFALTWNITKINPKCAPVESYHLFLCHDNSNDKLFWKKIGEIKALPLPMACTLSQFFFSNKYYFTVQSKDILGRYGPFSDIKAIPGFSENLP
ncbi:activating transcription factor 7-interacting protein 2 [Echinops telfairi]|uniref:Activating transcription factor 7-interacting protein 2 n=1 Tax=Echinops telfairi TaxID=9371 RepID=A0AC55CP83_ECHTE|nr:activating transcription factor 7-interacting protein 2 [Echinops telfairi]